LIKRLQNDATFKALQQTLSVQNGDDRLTVELGHQPYDVIDLLKAEHPPKLIRILV
jgi:hypothetical protein